MSRDFIELTPAELDELLIKKLGLGLFTFAYSFYVVLWFSFILKDGRAGGGTANIPSARSQKLKELIKRISNQETGARELVMDYDFVVNNRKDLVKIYTDDRAKAAEILDRDERLKDWILQLRLLKGELSDILRMKRRSSRVRPLAWLFGTWALQVREHKAIPKSISKEDWECLSNLFQWFWDRLAPYERYKGFEPKNDSLDPDYRENQFLKFPDRWEPFYLSVKWRLKDFGTIIIFGKDDCYAFHSVSFFEEKLPAELKDLDILKHFCTLFYDDPFVGHFLGLPDFSYLAY